MTDETAQAIESWFERMHKSVDSLKHYVLNQESEIGRLREMESIIKSHEDKLTWSEGTPEELFDALLALADNVEIPEEDTSLEG